MNISGINSSQMPMRGQGPSPEERMNKLVEKIESGDIDTDKLQERLSERFGEDATGIVADDGSVNIDGLKELFANNAPQGGPPPHGQGGMPPPPPPQGGEAASFEENLIEMLGEETVSGLKDENGQFDFQALIETLQANEVDSPVGSLFSAQA